MKTYLEHANITFKDIDGGIAFFQTAFPEFQVRGGGMREHGRWVHVGTDDTYIALFEAPDRQAATKSYDRPGFNHLGFVVEDVQGLADRLMAAGYARSYPKQEQRFRIRDYFLDGEGNEYEFVQYLSEAVRDRNDYTT